MARPPPPPRPFWTWCGRMCAVISYGQGNRYGHPTAQVLQRLLGQGISVYGTGKSGPIVLTTDGTTYSFNTSVTLTAHDAPSP